MDSVQRGYIAMKNGIRLIAVLLLSGATACTEPSDRIEGTFVLQSIAQQSLPANEYPNGPLIVAETLVFTRHAADPGVFVVSRARASRGDNGAVFTMAHEDRYRLEKGIVKILGPCAGDPLALCVLGPYSGQIEGSQLVLHNTIDPSRDLSYLRTQ